MNGRETSEWIRLKHQNEEYLILCVNSASVLPGDDELWVVYSQPTTSSGQPDFQW